MPFSTSLSESNEDEWQLERTLTPRVLSRSIIPILTDGLDASDILEWYALVRSTPLHGLANSTLHVNKAALGLRYRPPPPAKSTHGKVKQPLELTIEYGPQRIGSSLHHDSIPIVQADNEAAFLTWENDAKIYYTTRISSSEYISSYYMASTTGALLSKILSVAVEYVESRRRYQPFVVYNATSKTRLLKSSSSLDFLHYIWEQLAGLGVEVKPILAPPVYEARLWVDGSFQRIASPPPKVINEAAQFYQKLYQCLESIATGDYSAYVPTASPTISSPPTQGPTQQPSSQPSLRPTQQPSSSPTISSSTEEPTLTKSTSLPSSTPSSSPSGATAQPQSQEPSSAPSQLSTSSNEIKESTKENDSESVPQGNNKTESELDNHDVNEKENDDDESDENDENDDRGNERRKLTFVDEDSKKNKKHKHGDVDIDEKDDIDDTPSMEPTAPVHKSNHDDDDDDYDDDNDDDNDDDDDDDDYDDDSDKANDDNDDDNNHQKEVKSAEDTPDETQSNTDENTSQSGKEVEEAQQAADEAQQAAAEAQQAAKTEGDTKAADAANAAAVAAQKAATATSNAAAQAAMGGMLSGDGQVMSSLVATCFSNPKYDISVFDENGTIIETPAYLFRDGSLYFGFNLASPFLEIVKIEHHLPDPVYGVSGSGGDFVDWTLALVVLGMVLLGAIVLLQQLGFFYFAPLYKCQQSLFHPQRKRDQNASEREHLERGEISGVLSFGANGIPLSMGGRRTTISPVRESSIIESLFYSDNPPDILSLPHLNRQGEENYKSPPHSRGSSFGEIEMQEVQQELQNEQSHQIMTQRRLQKQLSSRPGSSANSIASLDADEILDHTGVDTSTLPKVFTKDPDLVDLPHLKSSSKVAIPVGVSPPKRVNSSGTLEEIMS